MNFGHYTAYAKNSDTDTWYDYNDSSCTRVDPDNLGSDSAAYVLYYIRRDFYPNP